MIKIKDIESKLKNSILYTVSILLLIIMFILPIFYKGDYSILRNSISELGAQFTPYAWITNLTLIITGIYSVIAGWSYFKNLTFHRIMLVISGVSLTLAAFFNHAPADPGLQYNMNEDGWHSYFLCTAGLSFVILTIATAINLERLSDKIISVVSGISVTILSILMSEAEQCAGIWQRLLFIISFSWIVYTFKPEIYKSENRKHSQQKILNN